MWCAQAYDFSFKSCLTRLCNALPLSVPNSRSLGRQRRRYGQGGGRNLLHDHLRWKGCRELLHKSPRRDSCALHCSKGKSSSCAHCGAPTVAWGERLPEHRAVGKVLLYKREQQELPQGKRLQRGGEEVWNSVLCGSQIFCCSDRSALGNVTLMIINSVCAVLVWVFFGGLVFGFCFFKSSVNI